MGDKDRFTSEEEVFLEQAFKDLSSPRLIESDTETLQLELLQDLYAYVPKISLYDSVDGWLELREDDEEFVLKCIGLSEYGLICNQIDHNTGKVTTKLIEGSVISQDSADIDDVVATTLNSVFFDTDAQAEPMALTVAKGDDKFENFLLTRHHVLRDGYLMSHIVLTDETLTENAAKENLREFGRFVLLAIDVELWEGDEKQFYVDLSANWAQQIQRGRLINAEGSLQDSFGRPDAPSWSINN